jgi:hypothetical protein
VGFSALVFWWLFFSCHGSTELVLSTCTELAEVCRSDTELHQKISKRRLWWVLELWCFSGYSFLATEARRHGITPKILNQKALVGFSAFVLWWLFFSCPGSTELVLSTCTELAEVCRSDTELHQKFSNRKLLWALVLWSFCGYSFLATEARNLG